jgi:GntR family transcriptional regulator
VARGAQHSEDPLYKHVKNRIVSSLQAGEWKPGEMLPSEAKLAAAYDVAVSTIRAAVGELAAAGVIVRRQGKGTFVAVHGESRSVYRFFNVVEDGRSKSFPVSELLALRKAKADDRTADLLRLPRSSSGPDVFLIRNMLRVEGTPVVVSAVTVPISRFPRLTEKTLREGGPTLYAVYQRRYGMTIVKIHERLKAGRADASVAKLFGMKPGEPLLGVQRIAYTFNKEPVEVRQSWIDTRRHHYELPQGEDA